MSDQSKPRFKVHPDLAKEFATKTLELDKSAKGGSGKKKRKPGDKPTMPVQYH